MSVTNNQPATATTFNNAFASKDIDNTFVGVQSLNNIGSDAVDDLQACLEQLFTIVGSFEAEAFPNQYSSNVYIADGDNFVVALGKLDAGVASFAATLANHETRITDIESNPSTFGGDKTFSDDVTIQGDLIVNGTTTTVNSATLEVADQNVLVNKGGNDASAEEAGVDVKRTTTNAGIRFDSTLASKWKLGLVGAFYEVVVTGIAQTISGIKDFTGGLKTDTVSESTTNAGVTVDGVLIKDGAIAASVVGLGSVTDDAQLKRAANDFSTFTAKTTPVAGDLFLIEDSAAGGAKKKVDYANITGSGSGNPVATIIESASSSTPSGYLPADGAAVSRTTYATLFAAISTVYGVGDGSTTFNVPNRQGIGAKGVGSQTFGGVTYTGVHGQYENDRSQGHIHVEQGYVTGGGGQRITISPAAGAAGADGGNTSTYGPSDDGTNGTPRTGLITEGATVGMYYYIKT